MTGAQRLWSLAAVIVLSCGVVPRSQAQRTPLVTFGAPVRIDGGAVFARVMSGGLAADGRFCIGDDLDNRISCLAPDGRLLWAAGGAGEGPGEFRMLYRVAVAPSGAVFAYDAGTATITRHDGAGALRDRHRLPLAIPQVSSMVALDDSTFAVSGAPFNAGPASPAAVHLFVVRDTVAYLRSFGRLPVGSDELKLSLYGAGLISADGSTLYYSRRVPYELSVHDRSGRVLREVTIRAPVPTPIEEQFVVERSGMRTRMGIMPPQSTWHRISRLRPLSDRLGFVTRTEGADRQVWDLVSLPTLEMVGTIPAPRSPDGVSVLGVDRQRSRLVVASTCDEEPCIMSVPYRIGG